MSVQGTPQIRVISDGSNTEGTFDVEGAGGVAWVSHVGHLRSRNEDRFLVKSAWDDRYLLLLVADGAGGHEAGDLAATQAVQTFDECFPVEGAPPSEGEPRIWLHDTIVEAHERVVDLATSKVRPPASTVVGVLVELASLAAWRFHVGDSRLYVRTLDGMVAQWTRDHNITNGLIDRGLSVEQAMKIADGGRLTQVLGGTSDIEPEIHGPLALEPGQSLLLCSDGIYGHNEDPEVLPQSTVPGDEVSERAEQLKLAVLGGEAPDNLTAVLWQIAPDLEPTLARDTITNSMPSVSAEAIESYIEKRNLANLAKEEEEDEPDTDSGLSPDDAPTHDVMAAYRPSGSLPADPGSSEDEETLNTRETPPPEESPAEETSPPKVPASTSSVPSARMVSVATNAAHIAAEESARDTRSALFLVFGLLAVLVGTYSIVVKDMRGEVELPGEASLGEAPGDLLEDEPAVEAVPGAEASPEAEDLPESEAAPEDEAAPESEAAPEAEAASESEAVPEAEAAPESEAAPEAEAAPEVPPAAEVVPEVPPSGEVEAESPGEATEDPDQGPSALEEAELPDNPPPDNDPRDAPEPEAEGDSEPER